MSTTALSLSMVAKDKALREAIQRAGGIRPLARALGIAMQAIVQWERVPPLRVLDVERITGVSRFRLRPDVYGPPPRG